MNKTLITLAVAGILTGTAATATQAAEAFSFSLGDILEISVVNTDIRGHHDRGPARYNPPPAPKHRRKAPPPPPRPEKRKHRHNPQPPPPPARNGGFRPATAPAPTATPAPGPAAKPATKPAPKPPRP